MFDYRQLAALVAVIDEGGFDKAAAALCLTQSAVSQRVRQLEERLGQILLIRSTPPKATAAGQALLAHLRQVRLLEDGLPAAFHPETPDRPVTLALGVNADSLATWFWPAVHPFLGARAVLFDLRVDDQDVTHRLLKNGEVVGCISAASRPMQGCRAVYLGTMRYRLYAAPDFARRWFSGGLDAAAAAHAPAAIFSRRDALQHRLLTRALGAPPPALSAHYIPSSEAFVEIIAAGHAYGALPEQQSRPLVGAGQLVDLLPEGAEAVPLYWHCWNLASELLQRLSAALENGARQLLPQD
jgi:LysR family transcriptional regulator (chromosome initiation inhibitor)